MIVYTKIDMSEVCLNCLSPYCAGAMSGADWCMGQYAERFNVLSRINAIGAAFAKDFEPWRIRNGALYISNRGNAQNVHIQVYELKEN